jgi:hypothetical protein
MTADDPFVQRWFDAFEKRGENGVRDDMSAGMYESDQRGLFARVWLEGKAAERDEATGDAWLIRAVEAANAVAAEAKEVSNRASAGAALSTVVAIAALLKSFGVF